ncbi:GAF domain-containing sensor histidine kinase [Kribbella swartbergensis]
MSGVRLTAVLSAVFVLVTVGGGLALLLGAGPGVDAAVLGAAETGLAAALLGLLVRWQRPENRIGWLLTGAGALFGLSVLAAGVLGSSAGPAPAEEAAFAWIWVGQAPLVMVWTITILALPDGELGAGLRRGFLVVAGVLAAMVAVAGYLFAGPGQVPEFPPASAPAEVSGPLAYLAQPEPLYQVGQPFLAVLPLLALLGLIARFRKADPVARQQLKWVLVAAALTGLANLARVALDTAGGALGTAGTVVGLIADPLPALAIALAVLRYRLWELDLFISHAIVYGTIWVALSAAFIGVALGAGLLAGGSGVLVPLLLALAVAVAGRPLLARLERLVRRLVYGPEPAGYAAVVRYTDMLTEASRSGTLAQAIAESVQRALGTNWAGVWLHVQSGGTSILQPAAIAGCDVGPAGVASDEQIAALQASTGGLLADDMPSELATFGVLQDVEPSAVFPLVAGTDLVGIIACGRRPQHPLVSSDLELLGVLGQEAALALRNVRLESELRRRLDEIEEQTRQLRRSRQRLVSVQDAERRRIERDLHDGVQQQLVALAAKLKRASLAAPAAAQQLLTEAATEAEETVFALQDLARGIYPSLLADQGLPAALRTHAARVPAAVRVEVEPALTGRRFGRDQEAALYFVALEAMANAQKHAAGAELTVSVHGADDFRRLVLEVHDDGPGFSLTDPTGGSGLQNMADRIAAVGGTLDIDSRPGAGTWIRAEVPLEARIVPLQRPAGDSRR